MNEIGGKRIDHSSNSKCESIEIGRLNLISDRKIGEGGYDESVVSTGIIKKDGNTTIASTNKIRNQI
jgi:hypothetical protein